METNYPKQREVYLCRALKIADDTKERPVVIVSVNERNQYFNTVLVVPFTTDGSSNLLRVPIELNQSGLDRQSWAMCERVTNIAKRMLKQGPLGKISLAELQAIRRGIQVAIGDY